MTDQQPVLEATIDALYRSLMDDDAWTDALRGLARAFDTPRLSLLRAPSAVDEPFEARAWNFDDETQQLYEKHYWSKDPTVAVSRDAPVGVWTNCDALLDPRTTGSPEYVVDFALKRGLRYVCGAKVYAGKESVVVFSLQRPADHKPFDESSERVFATLYPHLARVAMLSEELRRTRLSRAVSEAALDAIEWPIFAVTDKCRLLLANAAGTTQLKRGTTFRDQGGILTCSDLDGRRRLHHALKVASRKQASAYPVKSEQELWLVRVLPTCHHAASALVYAAPVDSLPASSDLLRTMLNFTEAEAQIAHLLADGYSVKEIAFERRVSVNTVRTQVRAILDKAGVRRQGDLTKLLLTIPRVSSGERAAVSSTAPRRDS